jgi:hypothetical protein
LSAPAAFGSRIDSVIDLVMPLLTMKSKLEKRATSARSTGAVTDSAPAVVPVAPWIGIATLMKPVRLCSCRDPALPTPGASR